MKTLIAAVTLVALIVPAHADKFRSSDRKWLAAMEVYRGLAGACHGATEDNEMLCDFAAQQGEKLKAAGYCLYARDGVGRPSRDRKHCYEIDFPE